MTNDLILGIETSCDETSASIVEDGYIIKSNIIASQNEFHKKYKGVVPEIASRKHLEVINYVIKEALSSANCTFKDISAVAVTNEPGLIGCLLIGVTTAKAIAYCHHLPLIGVNHLLGHIYANFIEHRDIEVPHICLTVSGGHTLLSYIKSPIENELIGSTYDDAAGEAYDKIAKYLDIGFPGGPAIDKLAKTGNPDAVNFPRPLLNKDNYDFSFSGLKTAVTQYVEKQKREGKDIIKADIVASFQQSVVETLVIKTIRLAKEKKVSTITIAGGVAANSLLREMLKSEGEKEGFRVLYPSMKLCTDNAAIIAGVGYHLYKSGYRSNWDLNARARIKNV